VILGLDVIPVQSIQRSLSFQSGLFFDNYGGIHLGQILHICGASGSGKTLLSTYLSLRFLYDYLNGEVIYFDADRTLNKQDIESICRSNMIPKQCLDRFNVYIPISWKNIQEAITETIKNSSTDYLFFVIDSLPNIFIGEVHAIIEEPKPEKENIKKLIDNIIAFFVFLKKTVNTNKNILITIINQVRSTLQNIYSPFWQKRKYIPAYWNLIQYFIDTCLIFEKIRHGMILARILFSQYYPETLGIIKINNLKIT